LIKNCSAPFKIWRISALGNKTTWKLDFGSEFESKV
jgi:hypothetical protein